MYEFLEEEIKNIYQDDNKKLRTQTVMYGKLEHRWHTYLHPGLTTEEIKEFESRVGNSFPSAYREFLSVYNGCYLFDLLRMGGKELESYKGLTIEEQVRSTVDVEDIQEIHLRKRTPKEHFIFADSLVKNTYYVMDKDEKVLEVDCKTKKVTESYDTLKDFIIQIIQEGKDNIANEIHFEFR
jgi:hypothetical protein